MVPRSILSGLASLRLRERLLHLALGGAVLLGVVVLLLLCGGLVDYLIDRETETPKELRYVIAFLQLIVVLSVAVVVMVLPWLRSLPNEALALRVEKKNPQLNQRLISAVQLNQEGADTEGMSPALIAQVTREAEKQAAEIPFPKVADHGRLTWAGVLAGPALVLAGLPFLLAPDLAHILLARQFLSDVDIPRLYTIEPIMAEVYPQGEKVQLRFKVKGPHFTPDLVTPDLVGEVRVRSKGQPQDRYELTWDETIPVKDGVAVYVAQLPSGSTDLEYRARLEDGRSRGDIKYVPLPVVIKQWAWVQLPAFCGLKPNGQPYELPQAQGDLEDIQGSSGRVLVQIQKPVSRVLVHLGKRQVADEPGQEEKIGRHINLVSKLVARKELEPNLPESEQAQVVEVYEGTFELLEHENFYEVEAVDEYGFVNKPRPRRGIGLKPEKPPEVNLLPEQFPPKFFEGLGLVSEGGGEIFVEGLPVLLGGKIRIPYRASGDYGLGQARVLYRVLKKAESGNDPVKEVPWTALPLGEVQAGPQTGPFLWLDGAFENSPFLESIPFHAIPSPAPDHTLGRKRGGGRYDLETTGLVDHQGKPLTVKIGDQIEYKVVVFADKDGKTTRPFGESETRVKTIVSLLELTRWMEETTREEQAIKNLRKKQEGVLDK